ncbi:MAG: hypothetical protein DWQ06_04265 [Calditrichaeota bacterium]|nr:MAG: hypothetical protein DWQ06_04265 [Calditrichota bacterium]
MEITIFNLLSYFEQAIVSAGNNSSLIHTYSSFSITIVVFFLALILIPFQNYSELFKFYLKKFLFEDTLSALLILILIFFTFIQICLPFYFSFNPSIQLPFISFILTLFIFFILGFFLWKVLNSLINPIDSIIPELTKDIQDSLEKCIDEKKRKLEKNSITNYEIRKSDIESAYDKILIFIEILNSQVKNQQSFAFSQSIKFFPEIFKTYVRVVDIERIDDFFIRIEQKFELIFNHSFQNNNLDEMVKIYDLIYKIIINSAKIESNKNLYNELVYCKVFLDFIREKAFFFLSNNYLEESLQSIRVLGKIAKSLPQYEYSVLAIEIMKDISDIYQKNLTRKNEILSTYLRKDVAEVSINAIKNLNGIYSSSKYQSTFTLIDTFNILLSKDYKSSFYENPILFINSRTNIFHLIIENFISISIEENEVFRNTKIMLSNKLIELLKTQVVSEDEYRNRCFIQLSFLISIISDFCVKDLKSDKNVTSLKLAFQDDETENLLREVASLRKFILNFNENIYEDKEIFLILIINISWEYFKKDFLTFEALEDFKSLLNSFEENTYAFDSYTNKIVKNIFISFEPLISASFSKEFYFSLINKLETESEVLKLVIPTFRFPEILNPNFSHFINDDFFDAYRENVLKIPSNPFLSTKNKCQ